MSQIAKLVSYLSLLAIGLLVLAACDSKADRNWKIENAVKAAAIQSWHKYGEATIDSFEMLSIEPVNTSAFIDKWKADKELRKTGLKNDSEGARRMIAAEQGRLQFCSKSLKLGKWSDTAGLTKLIYYMHHWTTAIASDSLKIVMIKKELDSVANAKIKQEAVAGYLAKARCVNGVIFKKGETPVRVPAIFVALLNKDIQLVSYYWYPDNRVKK